MKMKKTLLTTGMLLAAAIGNAQANTGDLAFVGVVTATTCDVSADLSGQVANLVQLGTADVSKAATPASFTLKAKDLTTCGVMTNKTATVSWSSPQLNAKGLGNASGSATGAWVELKAKNSKTVDTVVKQGSESVAFDATKLVVGTDAANLSEGEGLKFEATLNGGAVPGDYRSSAAFVIAYN